MEINDRVSAGHFLQTIMPGLTKTLPPSITPERFFQMAVEVLLTPSLRDCEPTTIISSLMKAATLGFAPVASLGLCYFQPRNVNIAPRNAPKKFIKACEFSIGYLGWKQLAEQSGKISYFIGNEVREGDVFEYEFGTNQYLRHIPKLDKKGKPIAYYVCAKLSEGVVFLIKNVEEIESLRLRNPDYKDDPTPKGAWRTDYAAMALAKVCRPLCRRSLPWAPGFDYAVMVDDTIALPQSVEEINDIGVVHIPSKIQDDQIEEGELSPKIHEDYIIELELQTTIQGVLDIENKRPELVNNKEWLSLVDNTILALCNTSFDVAKISSELRRHRIKDSMWQDKCIARHRELKQQSAQQ